MTTAGAARKETSPGRAACVEEALTLLVDRGGVASPNARLAVEVALDVVESGAQASLFERAGGRS